MALLVKSVSVILKKMTIKIHRSLSENGHRSEKKLFWSRFFNNLRRIEVYLTKIIGKYTQNQIFRSRISIPRQAPNIHNKSKGFTLLEVLIAITLTGLVMGSLFALQSQNKKLTIRSLSALDRLTEERALINAAWIGLKPQHQSYFIENIKTVPFPEYSEEKKSHIKNIKYQLESVDITDASHQTLFSTMHLVKKQ